MQHDKRPAAAPESLAAYPEILNTAQLAEILGRSKAHAHELCRRGAVPAVKVGRRWYISKARLLDLLNG